MEIKNYMKQKVISIRSDDQIVKAAELIIKNKIGTLPVVDGENRLIGIVKLQDILSLIMPDFITMMETFDFIHSFGIYETRTPNVDDLAKNIITIMTPPIAVKEDSGLLYSAAILHKNNCTDLPIINEEGILIGIASHVDIGAALIKRWKDKEIINR